MCRSLQKSLYRDDQLAQETLDDRSALGELVFHFNLQHIGDQRHESVLLSDEKRGVSF